MRIRSAIAALLTLAACSDQPDAGVDLGAGAGVDADAAGRCAAPLPALPAPDQPAALWLSELGLYRDIAGKVLAADARPFEPAHALWSDGAEKRRWLRLPPGSRIDTSDMDHWSFPPGAVLFKEFSRDGRRIETRVIARTGCAPSDTWMGAFVWNDDESDARFAPAGERNARGTPHDVPAAATCLTCHGGEPGRVLGFSAVQQPHGPPDLLTHPVPPVTAPPDPVTAAALGYLHANCGHCHNPNGSARPDTDMDLRLSVADRGQAAPAVRTTVGRPLHYYRSSPLELRVAPGDAAHSALLQRMLTRGTRAQMPPLATESADPTGIAIIRAWIESL